jgi:hypothetical protein
MHRLTPHILALALLPGAAQAQNSLNGMAYVYDVPRLLNTSRVDLLEGLFTYRVSDRSGSAALRLMLDVRSVGGGRVHTTDLSVPTPLRAPALMTVQDVAWNLASQCFNLLPERRTPVASWLAGLSEGLPDNERREATFGPLTLRATPVPGGLKLSFTRPDQPGVRPWNRWCWTD